MRYYSSFTFRTGAIPPRDLSADLDTTRVLEASEGVTPFSSGAFFPSTEKLACHHQRVKDPPLSLLFLRPKGQCPHTSCLLCLHDDGEIRSYHYGRRLIGYFQAAVRSCTLIGWLWLHRRGYRHASERKHGLFKSSFLGIGNSRTVPHNIRYAFEVRRQISMWAATSRYQRLQLFGVCLPLNCRKWKDGLEIYYIGYKGKNPKMSTKQKTKKPFWTFYNLVIGCRFYNFFLQKMPIVWHMTLYSYRGLTSARRVQRSQVTHAAAARLFLDITLVPWKNKK